MSHLLEELSEVISGCSRCGFCMVQCPAYGATKIEWDAARGRIRLAGELVKGNTVIDKELEDPIDTCLMCRSCYESCPSKVDTPRAIQLIRTIRYQEGKMKLPYRILFEKVFTNPGLMSMGSCLMSGVQATGLDKLGLGMAARFVPEAGAVARVMPRLPGKRARKNLSEHNEALGKKRGKVLYFLGCASDFAFPEVAKSTVRVLQSQGVEVVIPEVSCCGLPAHTYGHLKAAQQLAEKNIEAMKLDDVDAIISDCPTCLAFLQEYPELFSEGSLKKKAEALANKVQDVTEYLLNLELQEPKKRINKTITYHQPCHVGRYLNTGKIAETIMENLPGITFKKAENQSDCCGGAGSYCITQHNRSEKILDKKLNGIAKTNAELLVTNCPACIMQLRAGINNSKIPEIKSMEVVHLMQILEMIYT